MGKRKDERALKDQPATTEELWLALQLIEDDYSMVLFYVMQARKLLDDIAHPGELISLDEVKRQLKEKDKKEALAWRSQARMKDET